MRVYNNSVVLRNDGLDPLTSNADLNAGVGVTITVRNASLPVSGLGALSSIFDLSESPIANPMQTDNNGNYSFKIVEGIYDIIIAAGTASENIISGQSITAGGGSTVSELPPVSPLAGSMWTRCSDMKRFVYYDDGTSSQWVESNPSYKVGAPVDAYTKAETDTAIETGIVDSEKPEIVADAGTYVIPEDAQTVDVVFEGDGTLTLPLTLIKGRRFTARLSFNAVSTKELQIPNPSFTILGQGSTLAAGDGLLLSPGELVILEAISTTELEIL